MWKFLIAAIGLALLAFATFLIWKPNRMPDAVAGASTFFIPDDQKSEVITKALHGDCQAAYRLGEHYFFTTDDTEETLRWYRLAAKCPEIVEAKTSLIALLAHKQDQPKVLAEINKLIAEIRERAPERAESAQIHVDHAKTYLDRKQH